MQLKESKIRDEAELESLLVSNPNQIEEGFLVLTHQRKTHGFKTLDILGVDSEGILTLIELKVVVDSGQLKQALLYYDWILQQGLDWISGAYKGALGSQKISERMPQIFLIAPDFDEEMVLEAKYVREDIRIRCFKYITLELNDQKFVKLIEESITSIKEIESKPRSVQDIIYYILDKDVKILFIELAEKIRSIEKDIEEKPTEWNLTYWIKGRKFCDLYPRKQAFAVGYKTSTEKKWEGVNNIINKEQVDRVFIDIEKAFTLMKR
jgi:hypothetical protein